MKVFHLCILLTFTAVGSLYSQSENEIAKKLSNPLGYISAPFQNNFDFNIKPNNGFRWTLSMQPFIPLSLNDNWNLLNRLVVPVVSQSNIFKNTSQAGMSDLLVNSFLSPKGSGMIWGVGPAFYLPIGFPKELTSTKWGLGPNIIILKQARALTLALLVFHLWSVTGSETRPDFSFTYSQPMIFYNFAGGWGVGASSESSYEWKSKASSGAIIVTGSKLIDLGGQLINVVIGPKYYFGNINRPNFGIRLSLNLLFP
jgi:hypothetical protein